MDPYLEAPGLWPDVHQRLITYIADAIQPQVRPQYRARIEERVYLVEPERNIYPDVTLLRRPMWMPGGRNGGAAVAVADEPLTFTLFPTEHREPFIEIIHHEGLEVVTVLELLSPANKTPGPGRTLYLQKQHEILNSHAHLVEIDLLSRGQHTVALPESARPKLPPYRYLVCINRAAVPRWRFEIYPFALADRLPRIRIPLKEADPDVTLDLPALFDHCYENGAYADFVDYTRPPEAPLSAEETAWMTAHINPMLEQPGGTAYA
jgi:hypothetical protein